MDKEWLSWDAAPVRLPRKLAPPIAPFASCFPNIFADWLTDWLATRMSYGRNNACLKDGVMANIATTRTKQHPCLVPYDELPESERSYDVAVAEGLLKSLLALGCTIEVPPALPDTPTSIASPPTAS